MSHLDDAEQSTGALTIRKEGDAQRTRMLRRLRDGWAKVEASARNTLTSTIDFGRELLAAQEMFGRGTFCRLFHDHKSPLPDALPCSYEWARRAMRIAEHPVLADHKHACVLPRDVDAVFALSRLADDRLAHEIEEGTIRPTMTRKEARALVNPPMPWHPKAAPGRRRPNRPDRAIVQAVLDTCPVCAAEVRVMDEERTQPGRRREEDSDVLWRLTEAWGNATKRDRLRFLKRIMVQK